MEEGQEPVMMGLGRVDGSVEKQQDDIEEGVGHVSEDEEDLDDMRMIRTWGRWGWLGTGGEDWRKMNNIR
jgi:hypothetical protein